MPAVSKNQRTAMAIAEHDPSRLYKRNQSMLGMTLQQLHDFASTHDAGLPKSVKSKPVQQPSRRQRLREYRSSYQQSKFAQSS